MNRLGFLTWAASVAATTVAFSVEPEAPKPQYESEGISIAPASAEEARLTEFSAPKADAYLRHGAEAWNASRGCVSCHTNGAYMTLRPALSPWLGHPDQTQRDFLIAELADLRKATPENLQKGTNPAQVIYLAAGLAEWDRHVTKSLSPETREALVFMFELQLPSGTWGSLDCWPPYESDAYHLATVAAMAAATAPGWLDQAAANPAIEKLNGYLRQTPPPHDFSRVLLLWAANRMPGLVEEAQRQQIIEQIFRHQREDGGWSIRTFAEPAAWGRGNRADKLKAEPEFAAPPSDGHQTGLALVVLREAGVPANDPRLQRGIAWLKANQRESGRWWTRSLNTDKQHYITYSGTALPLLALGLCGELDMPAKSAALQSSPGNGALSVRD